MNIILDYGNMMKESVGERGIDAADFKKDEQSINAAFDAVNSARGKGWQEWTELPFVEEAALKEIFDTAQTVRQKAESFVVLGIGGSALGALAVSTALTHLRHNELPKSGRNAPKLYIEDNIDPDRMSSLLDIIDLKKTYFNVITKSGETIETLSQFFILYKQLKKTLTDAEIRERIIITTTVGSGALYDIAIKEGFKIFDIGKGVGGRFSVLSNVGLFPFAVMGFDVKALLSGAKDMSLECQKPELEKNPGLMSAYLQTKSMRQGKNISVFMPYSDSLKYMADFYAQLWGESLGKETDLGGNRINAGQTPVKALGVTDQHSQVQLYVEGSFDKVVTFLYAGNFKNEVLIPDCGFGQAEYLTGKTLNRLIDAERVATAYALTKAGRSNFSIGLPEINEYYVGQLIMLLEYQTAFAGAFLCIDTYNQPGVEGGKKAAFAILGKKGYEDKLKQMTNDRQLDYYIIK